MALAQCRSIRTASVLTPRRIRKASIGPGTGAGGRLEEPESLGQPVRRRSRPAAQDVGVAAEVLGGRVDDDVGPEPQRLLQVRRGQRVVDHRPGAPLPGQRRHGGDVDDLEAGVRRALHPHHAGLVPPGGVDGRGVGQVGGRERKPAVLPHPAQQAVGAAVDVPGDHEVVAGTQEPEDGVLGGDSAAEAEAVGGALQRGDAALQCRPGRVSGAGVEPSPVPLDVVLDEQRRLVDRARPPRRWPGRAPGRRGWPASRRPGPRVPPRPAVPPGQRAPRPPPSRGGDPHERRRRVPRGGAADMDGVAVVEDAPVGSGDPVPGAGVGGGHPDDRLGQRDVAGRAVVAGRGALGGEAEDAAVAGHHPVALAVGVAGHADDGLVELDGARRTEELGIAVGEDPAVGGHQPVAVAGRRRGHAHDRLGQVGDVAGRTEELGRGSVGGEAEDAAVAGHHPVAVAVGVGGDPDDGLVEFDGAGGAEEPGVAVVEDPAVGGHQPVALAAGGGGHPHDGLRQGEVGRRAERVGVAVAGHRAVVGGQPVADRGRHGEALDVDGAVTDRSLLGGLPGLQVDGVQAGGAADGEGGQADLARRGHVDVEAVDVAGVDTRADRRC